MELLRKKYENDEFAAEVIKLYTTSPIESSHSRLGHRGLYVKGTPVPLSSLRFEARTSVSSILQNISEKGLVEQVLVHTPKKFQEKIVKYSLEFETKSRSQIEQKKLRKIKAIKALKKYSKRPAKVPRYKQPQSYKATNTIVDIYDSSSSDSEVEDWF